MVMNNEEFVSNLSYEVVKEIAPDEIDLFEDIKEEFLRNPDAFSEKDTKKREKMLGFASPTDSGQFFTGFVLPIVKDVIWPWAKKKLDAKLDKKDVTLDKMEIKKLRDEAYNNAVSLGMNKEKAELMSDALAGKLILSL